MASGPRVAILLSTSYFEQFYEEGLGVGIGEYVAEYRHDWSWDYCAMLGASGITPHIYVPTRRSGGAYDTPEGYGIRLLPLGAAYRPWLRWPGLQRTPVGRFLSQTVNAAAFEAPLRAALTTDGIDVLCVQEYWTARFDFLVSRLEVPVVAVDQGLPSGREIKAFKGRSMPRADRIIVQTEREAKRVAGYGGKPVRIPNAVDTEYFSPSNGSTARSKTILTVTRLEDGQKRVSDLVRALAHLPREWTLQVVGTGPDRTMLEDLAAALGVSERVRFAGFVTDRDRLRNLYRRCAVFGLPSLYEGLPVALLEAMSCGAPVVATRIQAMEGVVEDGVNGLLVPTGSPTELAKALVAAAERREKLSAAGRETILAGYDKRAVGPVLAQVFGEVRRRA